MLKTMLCLVVLCAAACASAPPFQPRTLIRCEQSAPDPALEQERAYLAGLLTLQRRGYAITRSQLPEIDAEIGAQHDRTRWQLRVKEGGALEVAGPDLQADPRTEKRFAELTRSFDMYRCQAPEALREQTQTSGLVSAGGEQPQSLRDRNAELLSLYDQRAGLHVGRKIAFTAISGAVAGLGAGLLVQGAADLVADCDSRGEFSLGCNEMRGKIYLITGASFLAAGGVMLGFAVPRMVHALRDNHALGRRIKQLQLLTGPSAGASLRISF